MLKFPLEECIVKNVYKKYFLLIYDHPYNSSDSQMFEVAIFYILSGHELLKNNNVPNSWLHATTSLYFVIFLYNANRSICYVTRELLKQP